MCLVAQSKREILVRDEVCSAVSCTGQVVDVAAEENCARVFTACPNIVDANDRAIYIYLEVWWQRPNA
jgi:hypothetical protein